MWYRSSMIPMPVPPPTRYSPLCGPAARQLATWLERYANRKPVVKLSVRNTCWIRKARRGLLPLSAGRFYAILRYVESQKRLHEPKRMTLALPSTGAPEVKWGVPGDPMGPEGRGAGLALPLIPQRNFRD